MGKKDRKDIYQEGLKTILKFSALINSSLNIEVALIYAMQWAEDFMDAEASSVYELDEEKGELFIRIARGEKKEPIKKIKFKLGEGIAGRVVQSGQPMIVQDVRKEKFFSDKFDRITGFTTKSMICVPLILRNKPIGALQVLNKKSDEPFTETDLDLLNNMSQQIAVALDNAKLYNRLEKKFELTAQELKITQAQLIRTERLEAMGHLIQGVAHEIRNPITTIGGFAWRIKRGFKQDPKLQQYINIILKESERLENLVKTVDEFTNLLSARLTLDECNTILEQVLREFQPRANQQGVKILANIEQGLSLTIDSSQIFTALSNIMSNALESMPDGGELKLDAKHEPDHILITILDTGPGIPKEDLNSVYDPFFTTKTRGAGLGLSMVHQIVLNHDGEIKIESREGEGTTVTLRLPVKPQHIPTS
ncbi:MAG: ATP-binding protein [Thermodesulfobacteriota bacterium]|nr:ATP-binding protein [Thermodesulfobacteriota bacterium]